MMVTKSLLWTTEKPTLAGYYWYTNGTLFPGVDVVLLRVINDEITAQFFGNDYFEQVPTNGLWYGPLEIPGYDNIRSRRSTS